MLRQGSACAKGGGGYPFGPLAIPNENIRRCPRGQRTNPTNVAMTINGNRYFIHTTGILRFEEDITKDASYTSDGHAVHIMCDKIGKVWDMVPLRQSFHPSNFGDNTIQVRMNTMHTSPPSILRAPLCRGEGMRTPISGSVLQEEKEAEQMLVRTYVLVPILQPTLLRRRRGRKCYVTPAFLGVHKQRGTKSKVATSPLPSRGPKRGRKCYVTPGFLGVHKQRDTSKSQNVH